MAGRVRKYKTMEVGLLSLGDWLPDPRTGQLLTPSERHRSIVESAVRAELAGFDSVWIGEHHFCHYILSAPPVVLGAIAARTERIRLGTGVTLLPHLDPVRCAEDYATVDVVSGGRLELVVGRGILARSYAEFGQSLEQSREIYAEHLELLLRLWQEEGVSWSGKHRPPLGGVTIHPRPSQQPHPPIWVGGGSSNESVDLAARLGLGLMLPSVVAPPEAFAPMAERYRERFAAEGHPSAEPRVGAVNHVHVASTSEQAREHWRPHYESYWEFVLGLIRDHGAASLRLPRGQRFEPDYDLMLKGPAICGSPAEVADRLLAMRELLGLDVHLAMLDLGGLPPDELYRTIDLYGERVLPEIARAA